LLKLIANLYIDMMILIIDIYYQPLLLARLTVSSFLDIFYISFYPYYHLQASFGLGADFFCDIK